MASRGQSTVLGAVLLTGIVVLLAGTVGVAYLIQTSQAAEQSNAPTVSVELSASAEWVNLTHGGGDRLDVSDLEVVVRNASTEERYTEGDFETCTGDLSDGRFGFGDCIAVDGLTGEVRIYLVADDRLVYETVETI